jgi:hypothetical protein
MVMAKDDRDSTAKKILDLGAYGCVVAAAMHAGTRDGIVHKRHSTVHAGQALSVGVWVIPPQPGALLHPVSSYAKFKNKARILGRFRYRHTPDTIFAVFVEPAHHRSPCSC